MRIYPKLRTTSIALISSLALSSCAVPDWLGAGDSEPRLEGERYDVMSITNKLRIDEGAAAESIDIPEATIINQYFQGNYVLPGNLKSVRSVDIGDTANESFKITAAPIYAESKIFVVDGENRVSAFSLDLKKLWSAKIKGSDSDGQNLPGGIAFKNGKVFATTGFGKVAGINAQTGEILWETQINSAIRTSPSVDIAAESDRVFIATADNKTFALSGETGEIVWRHSNITEKTRKYSKAAPIVKNGLVAASYASGEIFGINALQGREIWSELLSIGLAQTRAASGLNDVAITPIVVDGILYATSAGGKLAALNFSNGIRIWEQSISGVATPWVAGRHIFIINEHEELVAMNRFDGRVKWIKELRNDEQKDDKVRIRWNGPIMADGKLIAHNNIGEMVIIDANSGNTISRREIPDNIYSPASVIEGRLYFVSNNAELVELQ